MDAQAQDRAHRIGQTREVHGEFPADETPRIVQNKKKLTL